MRRILLIILCICILGNVPVRAEKTRYVALTFDDGPSGRFTRRLLEGLEQRDVQATFLLCGYRLEIYPSLAKKIYALGHEIGLHGFRLAIDYKRGADPDALMKKLFRLSSTAKAFHL